MYDNRNIRGIILKVQGSVMFSRKVLVPSTVSTIICFAILAMPDDTKQAILISDSMARIYASVLGFVIVMRTSMAFGRFFEGVEHVTHMFSKWRDAFVAIICFLEASAHQCEKTGDPKTIEILLESKLRMLHWFSLLSALAAHRLQGHYCGEENQLSNIKVRTELNHPRWCVENEFAWPSVVKRGAFHSVVSARGQAYKRALEESLAMAEFGENSYETMRRSISVHSQSNPSTLVPMVTPVETPQSSEVKSSNCDISKDGDSCHWEEGECFNEVPVSLREVRNSNFSFRTRLNEEDNRPEVIFNITPCETQQLNRSRDMVHIVLKWILSEVSTLSIQKHLLIPPPILSRFYQELSTGALGFFMAMKIADVPFPFPFAQFLQLALYLFLLFCPFVILENVEDYADTSLPRLVFLLAVNLFACMGYTALNEISIELEDPFGEDDNDYPLHVQQWSILQSMEHCFFQAMPTDFNMSHFGGAKDDLDFRVQAYMQYTHTLPQKPSRKVHQTGITSPLIETFDKLKNTIMASVWWLRQHGELFEVTVPDRERMLCDLLEALLKVVGNEVPQSATGAELQQSALNSLFQCNQPAEDADTRNRVDAEDEPYVQEISNLINTTCEPELQSRLQVLLQRHATSARILRSAIAAHPSLVSEKTAETNMPHRISLLVQNT